MDLMIRGYREPDFRSVSALERENSPGDCKPEVFIRQAGVLFPDTFLVAEYGGRVVGYTIRVPKPLNYFIGYPCNYWKHKYSAYYS